MRPFALALSLTLVFASNASTQSKPAITPKDFGKWEALGPSAIAPNGTWFAYAVTRVNEENELRLRPIGRDTTIVAARGAAPVFSADSKWLAYAIVPPPPPTPARRATPGRPAASSPPPDTALHNAVEFRNLATGDVVRVEDITSFRFSADGRYLAMRRYAPTGKRGADVLVQDLANKTRMTFGAVGDYGWAPVRALLALTLDTDGGSGNGVHLFDANSGALRVLESSGSLYRAVAWRPKAEDLAVLRSRIDKGFKDTANVVLAWARVSVPSTPRVLDPAVSTDIPRELRIAESFRPEWAKDGSKLYIGFRPRERSGDSASKADSAERVSDVQVWRASDVRIMPMQRAQEQQDLQRTMRAAWVLASGKVIRIGTGLLERTAVLNGDAFATETDSKPYPFGAMFGRPYEDVYVVNLTTGERRRALEKVRSYFGGSATGRKLLWFDGKDFWTQDVASGARQNITSRVPGKWLDSDYDYPTDQFPSNGVAGWTKNDVAVLVYDDYDVWSIAPDGSGGRRLTDGIGDGVISRFVRTGDVTDGIDMTRPVYFSMTGKRTKKSGFARIAPGKTAERLVFDDARLARLTRADSSDVFAYTRERFDDSPDWLVGSSVSGATQVSATNPFQKDYAWGRAEHFDFKSAGGRDLQAALYYPVNYDPAKKYPMIVYTYETLSQNTHNYVVPSERSYYNITVFTANGYFVLTPDIVFRGRDPGPSVLEAVEPAVHTVVARGLVDSTKVGHVGHSWGGYEAAFLPTRTRIFAASVAGAPITDFFSFAAMVHWTPGVAEFDHWETGQARMEVPPWEDVEAYMRNSPVAKIQDLRTPVLVEVGDADGTVDWHQGLEYYNYARRAGKNDLVLLIYPGEDHGLRKKENQIDYERRILQWFGHYLKGDPAAPWMTNGVSWLERKVVLERQ